MKKTIRKQYIIVSGKRFSYKCKCKIKTLDCVTPEMWDESARKLLKRKKK